MGKATKPELRLDSGPQPRVTEDVRRFDLARLSPKATRTPQGFLKAPAFVTRAGVFEYRRTDGTVIRELRPKEEVFCSDSLATVANAPITRDHPKAGYVSPDNAKELSIGFLGESVTREDGGKVGATAIIMDAAAISDVARGELREFSMGYKCSIEWAEGEDPKHGRYDCIQRNIRYNHAAMGGISWGRAGPEVSLRLDSDDAVRCDAETALEHYVRQQMELKDLREADAPFERFELAYILGGWEPVKRADLEKLAKWLGVETKTLIALVPEADRADKKEPRMETIKITIGGVEFEVPKAAGQAMTAELGRRDSRISELETAAETQSGRFDAQAEELKAAKAKITELEDPARFDSAVETRSSLVANARKVLGEDAEVKGTDREIMEAALRKDNADLELSERSDDYVRARFDSLIEGWTPDQRSSSDLNANRRAAHQAGTGGGADKNRQDAEKARQDFREESTAAWQKPLSVSKQSA